MPPKNDAGSHLIMMVAGFYRPLTSAESFAASDAVYIEDNTHRGRTHRLSRLTNEALELVRL
jgi:hypothetical protein